MSKSPNKIPKSMFSSSQNFWKNKQSQVLSPKATKKKLPLQSLTIDTEAKNLRETGSTLCPTPKNLQEHQMSAQDFIFLKPLGKGKFGKVYLVIHKQTGVLMAIKVINKATIKGIGPQERKKMINQLIRQIKIQNFLEHPNIIKLYSFFDDAYNVYLIMELGCGGQLYQMMENYSKFSQQGISVLMRDILSGIDYMHVRNIIHRDLKPQNIVLIHGIPKICDFGWSVYCPKEFRTTLCGTPLYLSPQILKGNNYDSKIDTWAIGTLTYELLTGQNPFKITKKSQIVKIVTQKFIMQKGSYAIKDFITLALQKNPAERPTASKLLAHQFIQKYKQLQTCEQFCRKLNRQKRSRIHSSH